MTASASSLERFIEAQDGSDTGATYANALAELSAREKMSHWMWYVFPQLRGLGQSHRADHYGIADLGEARAYLAHTVLGPRLIESATTARMIPDRSAEDVFGSLDALKLHACATLFDLANPTDQTFFELRFRFFSGFQHEETLRLVGPGHYVFTEAVLDAARSMPVWGTWASAHQDSARDYLMRKVGLEAENEDEMTVMQLGSNNLGGGVPIRILRLLARLSRISP